MSSVPIVASSCARYRQRPWPRRISGFRRRAQTRKVRHASIGAGGQALSDINAFAKHPAFDLVAVADVDLCRLDRLLDRFPKARVYQDWRELLKKESGRLDSVNVSTPDHMHAPPGDRGDAAAASTSTCRSRWPTRCAKRAPLTEYARKARVDLADGDPGVVERAAAATANGWCAAASSARSAKCTRSRTRAGATTSRSRTASIQVPPTLDWDEWLGVAESRPFKRTSTPGRMAAPHRLRHRHARRHGLPHLQPALSRARS